jgi:kumamolisin
MHRPNVAYVVALVIFMVASGLAMPAILGTGSALPPRSPASTPAVPLLANLIPVPAGDSEVPLASWYSVPVTVTLIPPNSSALNRFLQDVENPSSPEYRHFLAYSQFTGAFAPSSSTALRVAAAMAADGARSISVYPDHSSISALLSPAAIEQLFGVRMVRYGAATSGGPEFSAIGTARLAPELRGLVQSVSGLSGGGGPDIRSNLAHARLMPLETSRGAPEFVNDTATGSQWFVGTDYAQEFGASALLPNNTSSVAGATFPRGVAIATLLASGYNQSLDTNLPSYDPAVVAAYYNGTFPTWWPKPNVSGQPVTIDGVTPPAPGSFGSVNDSSLDEFENSLDLEMAGSMAPGAQVVNFYFAGSLLSGSASDASVADDFATSLSLALSHNYTPARLAVVSCSFGLPDLNDSSWNFEAKEAAAMGVTISVASGDQGNAPDGLTGRDDGQWPTWPATADFNDSGAIAVGGISMTVGGRASTTYPGNGGLNLTYDSNMTGILSQSAWYDTTDGVAGTEGGVSTVFPEPYFQFHSAAQPEIRNATIVEGAPSFGIGRAEPDVAMPANDTIATVWANSTEGVYFTVLEGTSVAAPVFAGLIADIVAVESNRSGTFSPLGFFDPEIYNISSYFAANPSASDPFSPVTTGGNYVFTASSGWDPLTGWGTVNATKLLAILTNSTIVDYRYTGPTPGLPPTPSSSSPPIPWAELYILIGAAIVVAVVVLVLAARPRRPTGAPSVPFGAQAGGPGFGPGAQGGVYPGATFLCPYCGAVRPAEPVRCPQCGAY